MPSLVLMTVYICQELYEKPSLSRLEERPSGSLELILGSRFGHLPSFPLHLLLQNLEGTNFLRIFAAKKWKEDETNEVV